MAFDLLVKRGHVKDPMGGIDGQRDIAFNNGMVADIAPCIPSDQAREIVDAQGCIVTPGLIDLHSHVYWGGTSIGIEADQLAARAGVTTFVDAGSSGAGNFLGFRNHVIERSKIRILAFLNISFGGIFAWSRHVRFGESSDPRLCDPVEASACARDHADLIVGLKVRAGEHASGDAGMAPVRIACGAADQLDLPMMVHLDETSVVHPQALASLRPGDILTHCFRPLPNCSDETERLFQELHAARARGIALDLGHGSRSFDFEAAKLMLERGIRPDFISSDVSLHGLQDRGCDLIDCMSKLLALGLPLCELIGAATHRPAAAIGRPDLGRLEVGKSGDAAVLRLVAGQYTYHDTQGRSEAGAKRLVSAGIVTHGRWRANTFTEAFCIPVPMAAAGPATVPTS